MSRFPRHSPIAFCGCLSCHAIPEGYDVCDALEHINGPGCLGSLLRKDSAALVPELPPLLLPSDCYEAVSPIVVDNVVLLPPPPVLLPGAPREQAQSVRSPKPKACLPRPKSPQTDKVSLTASLRISLQADSAKSRGLLAPCPPSPSSILTPVE